LQAKQKTIIQKKIKILQKSQDFKTECTIKFVLENVQIHVNLKRN